MTETELMARFAAGTLAAADFHHRDHVHVTWLLLQQYGRRGAEPRIVDGLRGLAARAGKPLKLDGALTLAWIDAVDAARRQTGAPTFDALVAARPDLLDRRAVRMPV